MQFSFSMQGLPFVPYLARVGLFALLCRADNGVCAVCFWNCRVWCAIMFCLSAVSRVMAQSWCVDNGFELVELHPEENSDDDEGALSLLTSGLFMYP